MGTYRTITLEEIENAANDWGRYQYNHPQKRAPFSKGGKVRFIWYAIDWLKKLGWLEPLPEEKISLFNKIFERRHALQHHVNAPLLEERLKYLQYWSDNGATLSTLRFIAHYLLAIIDYLKLQKDDVKILLEKTEGNHPTDIRDRAIIMLLTVYGLRCGEVKELRLEDIDWENEVLYVQREKNVKSQKFPLSQTVGDAILNYLQNARPNNCHCREIFITRRAPYRSLSSSAFFQIVSKRMKPLGIDLKHFGPHSLRHACATRLINERFSLKEISDHLGHQSLESTRIYAKADLTNLRKVADLEIGDLI